MQKLKFLQNSCLIKRKYLFINKNSKCPNPLRKFLRYKPFSKQNIFFYFCCTCAFLFSTRIKNIGHWGNNKPTWLMLFLWDLKYQQFYVIITLRPCFYYFILFLFTIPTIINKRSMEYRFNKT